MSPKTSPLSHPTIPVQCHYHPPAPVLSLLGVYGEIIFSNFWNTMRREANRRSTLIYQRSFRGVYGCIVTGATSRRRWGRGQQTQLRLMKCKWVFMSAGESVSPCPAAICLLSLEGRNLWPRVICSCNNYLSPLINKRKGNGWGGKDVQLAKIRTVTRVISPLAI